MSKFKIGDWIRDRVSGEIFQHKENCRASAECQENYWELWQPQINEWCWYKHMLVKVISVDKRDDGIIRYVVSAPMYAEQYSGAIALEPFIGTLPSFSQGK